jgi:hypothetical protein
MSKSQFCNLVVAASSGVQSCRRYIPLTTQETLLDVYLYDVFGYIYIYPYIYIWIYIYIYVYIWIYIYMDTRYQRPDRARYQVCQVVPGRARSCQVPDRARYQIVPGTWSCQVPVVTCNPATDMLFCREGRYWIFGRVIQIRMPRDSCTLPTPRWPIMWTWLRQRLQE